MSYQEQERALFDLLFDNTVRENFCKDSIAALYQYELSEDELNDFNEIRPDALELDAKIRADLLLSHLCRAFPVSFSIVSSLDNGFDVLKELIDVETMRTATIDRATYFGRRLGESLQRFSFSSTNEQAKVSAVLEAELGMAWTSASLKREVLENGQLHIKSPQIAGDWSNKNIKLAPYVCAAMIPESYEKLKNLFYSESECDLWRSLCKKPFAASKRKKILEKDEPRLFVARAHVSHMSQCEPTIDQKTAELSEGFAPLFQHVNGTVSVDYISEQLKQIGAQEQMLQSIKATFKQLLESEMLEFS
ncbi:MAG: hypothetical protein HND53_12950 [Proteobacteria bacterium]|nr:hypothetical protein [Pseudomonadota bacterium]